MKTRQFEFVNRVSLFAVLASMLFIMSATFVEAQQRAVQDQRSLALTGPLRPRTPAPSRNQNRQTESLSRHVRYDVVPIGVLPGKTNSYLFQYKPLNNLGDATGFSYVYTGDFHSVYATAQGFTLHNGRLRPLAQLSGYEGAFGVSINDLGQVAGIGNHYDSATGFILETAVRWDNGQPVNLGGLKPNSVSYGFGINNWGTVVGASYSLDDQQFLPAAWYGGAGHALPLFPDASGAIARQINDLGMIIGSQFTDFGNTETPCLWYWNGNGYTALSLGSLGGDYGQALGINVLGQAVGWTTYAGDLHSPPFIWDFRGMRALPLLPGDTDGEADKINDLGQIIGYSLKFDDQGNFISGAAVIWEHETPVDLQTLVPPGTPSFDTLGNINDLGEIAFDNGDEFAGTVLPYLLVPRH